MIMLARLCGGAPGIGDGHHDRDGRTVGRRGEPLLTVDDVVVAVGDRSGGEQRRVRAGRLRLGHRETTADRALDERSHPEFLLFLGAVLVEDLDVAGVGGLGAEHGHPERAAADLLDEQTVLDERKPETTELDREVRRPQPHLLDLRLSGRHPGTERFGRAEQHLAFERDHLAIHELAHHRQHRRHLLGHLKVHDHLRPGHATNRRAAATRVDRP